MKEDNLDSVLNNLLFEYTPHHKKKFKFIPYNDKQQIYNYQKTNKKSILTATAKKTQWTKK